MHIIVSLRSLVVDRDDNIDLQFFTPLRVENLILAKKHYEYRTLEITRFSFLYPRP